MKKTTPIAYSLGRPFCGSPLQPNGPERTFAMKRYSMLFAVTVWFLVTFDGNAQGTGFTYQGRLNEGENLASGVYDFQFTIYDSSKGLEGIVAGPVTKSATAVNNG